MTTERETIDFQKADGLSPELGLTRVWGSCKVARKASFLIAVRTLLLHHRRFVFSNRNLKSVFFKTAKTPYGYIVQFE